MTHDEQIARSKALEIWCQEQFAWGKVRAIANYRNAKTDEERELIMPKRWLPLFPEFRSVE